jgi:pyrroloquinoline quinone (PQQ) biosynthesis protein C
MTMPGARRFEPSPPHPSALDFTTAGGFRDALLSVMDRKHHPWWDHLNGPKATRREWLAHFRQEWELYVRDFPLFLRRVHERCPVESVRRAIMENVLEEEKGAVSGAGPHAELFLHMMDGFGHSRDLFRSVMLLPAAARYRQWIDDSTGSNWLVGAAVSMIFVEGSIADRAEVEGTAPAGESGDAADSFANHPLVIYQGLDPKFLELKRVHRRVEGGHRLDAYRAVVEHAKTVEERTAIHATLRRSLEFWMRYRDELAFAAAD